MTNVIVVGQDTQLILQKDFSINFHQNTSIICAYQDSVSLQSEEVIHDSSDADFDYRVRPINNQTL
jgi:hypothetical protein